MSNPRIYIVILTFLPMVGGAEKQALAHARSLRERGLEATIVTLRHDRSWLPREVIEDVTTIRVAGTLLGGREKLAGPLRKLAYLLGLLVMCWTLWQHRKRYDVLHLYQLGLQTLPVAVVCRLTGKPLIVSVRAAGSGKAARSHKQVSILAGPLDANAPWLQVRERTQIDGDLAGLERPGKFAVRLTRFLLRRIHAVIVILSSQMKGYLAAYDFNLPGTQFIPNGVDVTRFTPIDTHTSPNERAQVVICVTRLAYQKGVDVLLQAWYLVQQQFPQARLIIVGIGPSQPQLERLAQVLDIRGSIEFAGLQHDVSAQFHRGGLAVLPSRCEGMPNAVLEAMACGLPCVATRVSGCEDIIQHGVNGLLVEPEDYQGMAQALLTLLRDPALAEKYGQAARASIEKHYSLEHITDMYVELYQRIAGHRSQIAEAPQPSEIYHVPS
jgi:glycosyltransferase involved in cell wall biosynthesis